jgi:hypothetical protein
MVLVIASVAFILAASAVEAQPKYTMNGKYGRKVGAVINIPLAGSLPCLSMGHGANLQQAPTGAMGQLFVTPLPVSIPFIPINTIGCIQGFTGSTTTRALATMGASVQGANPATFTMPTNVFNKPLPGALLAVPVGNAPVVQQLATSWGVGGPLAVPQVALNGTMATGNNTAVWRRFKKDAWMTQTGRAGPTFTACWGFQETITPGGTPDPFGPCIGISAGTRQMVTKYKNVKANKFGGTMGLLLQVGANTGSVALVQQPWFPVPSMNIGMQPLAGSGSAVGGRGYNVTRAGAGGAMGSVWGSFMTTMSPATGNGLVATVMNFLFPLTANAANTAHLPFTTGTVLARNTGTQLGNPNIVTFTAKGNDTRTSMGVGNITLVAGGMNASASGANAPTVDIMKLTFAPEPGAFLMLVAGGLFVVGADRVRSRRRS